MTTEPAVSMPKYIGPDLTPVYGPPTRADVAVDIAIRRGYGGYVTDDEIAADGRGVADHPNTTET